VDAKFWTDGCGSSIACGSVTTALIKGKSISEALGIDSDFILNALDGLPKSDAHCAKLASKTLRKAIKNHLSFTQSKVK
jgi:nitrogen fixation NifU-like protein